MIFINIIAVVIIISSRSIFISIVRQFLSQPVRFFTFTVLILSPSNQVGWARAVWSLVASWGEITTPKMLQDASMNPSHSRYSILASLFVFSSVFIYSSSWTQTASSSLINCIGISWASFDSMVATGVASVKSFQNLPPMPNRTNPGWLQAKQKPNPSATVVACLG